MKTVSRRKFLSLGLCVVVGGIVQEVVSGCSGEGVGQPRQLVIMASSNGSILDITGDKFHVDAPFVKSVSDNKVVEIGTLSGNKAILASDNLVFEVNNGGELIGGGVSATHTQVSSGDMITWKMIG